MRLVERWRSGGNTSDHPALPFLALTVLAASRMGGYEGFAAHKFTFRFAEPLIQMIRTWMHRAAISTT